MNKLQIIPTKLQEISNLSSEYISFLRCTFACAETNSNKIIFCYFKGTTKLYFMHYLCVVIIFKIRVYLKSAFSTYCFWDIVFCLSVFYAFFVP